MAAGVPTICNSMSGTAELVKEAGGFVIDEPQWNYKPANINKPPKLDIDEVSSAMESAVGCPRPRSEIVDIKNIAQQYYSFFCKVLDG